MQKSLLVAAVLFTTALIVFPATAEIAPGMARATFAVHCYDVGYSALSGKPGVISVKRGWSGAREVDRVIYNPQQVSLTQLEDWLKASDTYVSTLEQEMSSERAKGD